MQHVFLSEKKGQRPQTLFAHIKLLLAFFLLYIDIEIRKE